MNRLPLKMVMPPAYVSRSIKDHEIFLETLDVDTINKTEMFLWAMKSETEAYIFYRSEELAKDLLSKAKKMFLQTDDVNCCSKALSMLHNVINRVPSNTETFFEALLARGTYYAQQEKNMEKANSDLMLYLEHGYIEIKTQLGLFQAHGLLAMCKYTLKRSDVMEHVEKCEYFQALIPKDIWEKSSCDDINQNILQKLPELKKAQLNEMVYVSKVLQIKKTNYIPFNGFNTSADVPLCSGSCFYIENSDETEIQNLLAGVHADTDIPKDKIVFVEDPILFSFATPFANCELCFKQNEPMYTCLKCRFKTYCSVKCMKDDEEEHQYECQGYKYLILLVFDATTVFRLFMRSVNYLAKLIKETKPFPIDLITIEKVWTYFDVLLKSSWANNTQLNNFLLKKPNYWQLTVTQFTTLLTSTLRLTVFVYHMTRANEILFDKFKLSMKETLNLIGSVILRLNCHIILNSVEVNFFKPMHNRTMMKTTKDEKLSNYNAEKAFYTSDEYEKVYQQYKNSSKNNPNAIKNKKDNIRPYSVRHDLNNFIDLLTLQCMKKDFDDKKFDFKNAEDFECNASSNMRNIAEKIGKFSEENLYMLFASFARNFHIYVGTYFYQRRLLENGINQVVSSVCSTMLKFKHSCMPNVQLILLDDGVFLGKTIQQLKQCEKLTISFSSITAFHYSRIQRHNILEEKAMKCSNQCCSNYDVEEPVNLRSAIYCDKCKNQNEITPLQGYCVKCKANYKKILQTHYNVINGIKNNIATLEEQNKPSNANKLTLLYGALFYYVSQYFVKCHEQRLSAELKFIKHLADSKFYDHASGMLFSFRNHIELYDERTTLLGYYADVLEITKTILSNIIDHGLDLDPNQKNDFLSKLCALGNFILTGQEGILSFYASKAEYFLDGYKDMIKFEEWQDKIDADITMSEPLKKLLLDDQ